MSVKKGSKAKKSNSDLKENENLQEINEEKDNALELEIADQDSGAELYVEEAPEVKADEIDSQSKEEKFEDDAVIKPEKEEIGQESDEEPEEDLEEEFEEEEEGEEYYEKIKQDLLKEYSENKDEEESVLPEEDENQLNTFQKTEDKKISSDDDLEIEDIEESFDGSSINKPKSLNQEEQFVTPDVDQGFSKVAISKGSSIAIIVAMILVFVYIIYQILQPSAEELEANKSTINKNAPIIRPVEDVGQTIVVPEIPKFPEMPQELVPPSPKALPTPPMPATLDIAPIAPPQAPVFAPIGSPTTATTQAGGLKPIKGINTAAIDKAAAAKEAADAARRKARIKSSMMAGGGGGGAKKGVNANGESLSILQRNSDQTVATHIGELQRVIAAGKVIDAVLETAINTDLPGLIRAVVSRDVYSEAGNNVLITKGSRLIGSYSSTIKFGQARVQIAWDRVIRPDGIDIKVSSPGIDDIGRSGSAGQVDNHIMRNFTTAMMVSMINIAVAEYAERNGASTNTSTTTTNTDGSTTNTDTSSPVDDAYDDAVNQLSDITKDVIDKTMDMPPTITIDQGTSLKVFVKTDLVFPGRSANLTRLVE